MAGSGDRRLAAPWLGLCDAATSVESPECELPEMASLIWSVSLLNKVSFSELEAHRIIDTIALMKIVSNQI